MSDTELAWLSATELAERMRSGDVSPVEVIESVLNQLDETNPAINAFVTVTANEARTQARAAEKLFSSSDPKSLPRLTGLPISVKDLTDTAGVRTTYGSMLFRDHVPERDDVAWARLRAAGAILIGKTTTPEFGMLGITESQLTGKTNNPWNTGYTPGGSSGGAAAATAAGIGPLAWGSDGGGSIRVPAACCGVVGLKASMGRIPSERGESSWGSVSTSGPITRTVEDAALLLSITAGPDPYDPLSLPHTGEDFVAASSNGSLIGTRIAYSSDLNSGPVDPEVREIVGGAVRFLADNLGAIVEEVTIDLPDPIEYFTAYWSPSFAVSLDDSVKAGELDPASVHPKMLAMAHEGRSIAATEYWRTAHQTRGRISNGFARIHEAFEFIVTPTMPLPAFPHPGPAAGPLEIGGEPTRRPEIDFHRITEPASHAGLPAITIPCGFTRSGLPVGLQIIGRHHADAAVLAAAGVFEHATLWHTMRPPTNSHS